MSASRHCVHGQPFGLYGYPPACVDCAQLQTVDEMLRVVAAWLRAYAEKQSGSHPANAGYVALHAAASEVEEGAPWSAYEAGELDGLIKPSIWSDDCPGPMTAGAAPSKGGAWESKR